MLPSPAPITIMEKETSVSYSYSRSTTLLIYGRSRNMQVEVEVEVDVVREEDVHQEYQPNACNLGGVIIHLRTALVRPRSKRRGML